MNSYQEEVFVWEDIYGTDNVVWFEEYGLHLPYWVSYMPEEDKVVYVNEIRKTKEWEK